MSRQVSQAKRRPRRVDLSVERLESRELLAAAPIAEWRFDSSSGTVLVDSVGTSNGTVTGSSVYNETATALVNAMPVWTASDPAQWGTGTQGGALRLFSDTDGAIVNAASAPEVTSVSLWFKADTTNPTRYNSSSGNGGNTSGTPVAMPLFESGSSTRGISVYLYNNRLYVGAWNNGVIGWSSGTFLYTASNAVAAGRWHHVVLTLPTSGSLQSDGMKAYLDGVEFGSGYGASIGAASSIGLGRVDGTTRFQLGTSGGSVVNNDSASGNNHRGFAGYLDEARVYDQTLSAADVVEIRDETAPTVAEEEWLIRDSGRAATIGRFRFAGQLASEHFVIKWGTGLPSVMQPISTYIQQNLNRLEMSWDILVDESGMDAPSARNGVNYKVNVYVLDTGLWWVDSGGGTFSGAFAGNDPTGFAALYVSPWAMAAFQNPRSINVAGWGTVANTTTMPHEFMHVLQAESGGFANNFSGPFYETHANYGASLVDAYDTGNFRAEVTARSSINGRYGERRHRYSMATDFRYQSHLFLNYLSELPEYGAAFVNAIWFDPAATSPSTDQWEVLRDNFSSDEEFARVYAEFVASSVTYKALYDGALLSGLPSIPAHDTTQRLFRTYLEPVGSSPGWYQVPEQDTPEQYGSNLIKLTPVDRVAGQPHTITVDLDGYVAPGQTAGVYATLVAIKGSGASVMERYSDTWQSGEMTFVLAPDETDLYLTVTAVPSAHVNYLWSNPFYPTGGVNQGIERFPYRVAMTGAVPVRSEEVGERPAPNASAVRHTNPDGSLGGWKTVTVPSSVYLGSNVWVTGGSLRQNARIEDYATVTGGIVLGAAVVRGNALVTAGVVGGSAVVEGYAVVSGGTVVDNARVGGDALVQSGQVRGDALVTDYATITGSALVSGQTVIKGYGVVDGAQMTGDAMVMSSGLAAGTGLVTDRGVQYNGEPSSQEAALMSVDYDNLFARYLFDSQDDNIVWENFNTTYGWMSDTPADWSAASGIGRLSGVLGFSSDEQYVELSTELANLNDMTIQLWTRWDGTGDENQKLYEFYQDEDNYFFFQPASSNGGGALFEIAVDGVVRTLRSANALDAGQWRHVAVTFEGDTATLYINASAVATKTSVGMNPSQVRATSALLGKGMATGSGYQGSVDELLVYSDARTAAEILADVREVYTSRFNPAPDAEVDHDPGDYNRDGVVDAADYTVWRDALGTSVTVGDSADGNRDGTIDQLDHTVWAANYGVVTPAGQPALALATASESEIDEQAEVQGETPAPTAVPQVPLRLWSSPRAALDDAFESTGASDVEADATEPLARRRALLFHGPISPTPDRSTSFRPASRGDAADDDNATDNALAEIDTIAARRRFFRPVPSSFRE